MTKKKLFSQEEWGSKTWMPRVPGGRLKKQFIKASRELGFETNYEAFKEAMKQMIVASKER